jgi:hypothetical protein
MSFIDHGYDRMLTASLPRLKMIEFTTVHRAEPAKRHLCYIEYDSPEANVIGTLDLQAHGHTKGEALKNALALLDK